jgi:hypothetical protein
MTELITVLGSADYLQTRQSLIPASRLLVPWESDGDGLLLGTTDRTIPQFQAAAYYTITTQVGPFDQDGFYHFWHLGFKRTDDALFQNALTPAFIDDLMTATQATVLRLARSQQEKHAWLLILQTPQKPIKQPLHTFVPATMQDFIERSTHSLSGFYAHIYVDNAGINGASRNDAPSAPTK